MSNPETTMYCGALISLDLATGPATLHSVPRVLLPEGSGEVVPVVTLQGEVVRNVGRAALTGGQS